MYPWRKILWIIEASLLLSLGKSFVTTSSQAARKTLPRSKTALFDVAFRHHAVKTTIAGKLWPVIQKFHIGPQKAIEIAKNIAHIGEWQDIAFLLLLAYGTYPIAKFTYDRLPEDRKELPFYKRKRFGVSKYVSEAAKLALSVYAVDVICVALTTLGFTFPNAWHVPNIYAKCAYSTYALRQFLIFKKIALCRLYRVRPSNMGRVELLDRLLNGLSVALVTLLLFDWLSVQMGMAIKGLVAFGSVGTLAFTLASQGLISQLLAGVFLSIKNMAYAGDVVRFGDGTSGKVIKMGWMETVLRGPDNTQTSIPNSLLAGQKISNLSRVARSQVKQTLRFHYADADEIPALLETIREEIKTSCPKLITDGSRPFRVFFTDYKEDHLEVMVETHHFCPVVGDEYYETRQAVLMAIYRAVKKHGLKFAELVRYEPPGQDPQWRIISQKDTTGTSNRSAPETTVEQRTRAVTVNGEENKTT